MSSLGSHGRLVCVPAARAGARRVRVLTWHVHGSYLAALARVPVQWYLPVKDGRPDGYLGRTKSYDWPDNVHEVDVSAVADLPIDVVLTQHIRNWQVDRHELLPSARLRELAAVHVEHDPPRGWPNDALHPVQDEATLLVHVTPFNHLMWDSGVTPTRVVEHGVLVPSGLHWTGELERGVTVVNNLTRRGRRLGADIFARAAAEVPLDLFGINAADVPQGVASLAHAPLHARLPAYRFFFNPIRYTSLGLAVCEAMALGLPVLGLATTEMATVITSGVNGYVETDVDRLVAHARRLLADREEAAALSVGARAVAAHRFGIQRFATDWLAVLQRAAAAR